jgi:chromosome segregation ATPase
MPKMTLEKLAIMVARGFEEIHEKIDALSRELDIVKQDVTVLKQDVAILKQDMHEIKEEMRLQRSELLHINIRTERLEKKQEYSR